MNLIQIIEDDASCRNSTALVLRLEGFEVRTAEDAETGIAMIRERRPDLILCDIMMPGMNGHSVLELLKSDRSVSEIPFIFMTALGDRADVRKGMSEGADDYLSKPFSSEELVAAVVGRLHRFEIIRQRGDRSVLQDELAYLTRQTTGREREILALVGLGFTSKEIAKQLKINKNTVDVHRANLMKKLDVPNAANLARWAVISELMSTSDR
ncbi:MAG: response regulator transcription factor [Desulfuromonadales bacterium]